MYLIFHCQVNNLQTPFKKIITPLRVWVPLNSPHLGTLYSPHSFLQLLGTQIVLHPGWRILQMPQRQIEASLFPRCRFVIFIVSLHTLFCSLRGKKKRRCRLKLASFLWWAAESVPPKGSCWAGVLRDEGHKWSRNYPARRVCSGRKRALTGISRENKNAPQRMYKIVSERQREWVYLRCS